MNRNMEKFKEKIKLNKKLRVHLYCNFKAIHVSIKHFFVFKLVAFYSVLEIYWQSVYYIISTGYYKELTLKNYF